MSIIRVEKNKENPYVLLNKTIFDDENLSLKSKGIFCYLMSKPDGWRCQVADIANHCKDGRDSIRAGLRELREHGYMIKRPLRGADGKITEWEEVIFETPQEIAKDIFKKQNKTTDEKTPTTKKTSKINAPSINGKSTYGLSTSGKGVAIVNNNTNNKRNIINNEYTTQTSASSENVSIIETKTHLKLSSNQSSKVSNWDIERLNKAIEIFKNQQGKYFSFLMKIYNDNGNFTNNKPKKDNFNNYEQREYDFNELERKLLGWD